MSSIVISGDSSGSITLAAPAVAGTNTLTLPAATGSLALGVYSVTGTLTNVTASRALGTTYTNSTGNAIFVSVYTTTGTSAGSVTFSIDGTAVGQQGISAGATCTCRISLTFIVPNGSTYNATSSTGTNTLTAWYEIR